MAEEAGSEQLVRIARLNTILSVTFAVVFSAAAGYRMGPSVWMFHSQKAAKVQTVSTSSSRVEKDLYKEAAETVVAANIFGKLPPKAVYTPGKAGTQGGTGGRKTATGEMPRTSLHLDITGLIYSDDHKRGLVIIKTGKDEDNYREGDLIRGTRARIRRSRRTISLWTIPEGLRRLRLILTSSQEDPPPAHPGAAAAGRPLGRSSAM